MIDDNAAETSVMDGLDDRAALQAQLALLAVQLTEFCQGASRAEASAEDVVMSDH